MEVSSPNTHIHTQEDLKYRIRFFKLFAYLYPYKYKDMNNQKFIIHIREHIANNQFDTALRLLRDLLDNSPQLDEVIQQAGRYASIRQQIRLGTVSHANATLTENQIRMGLLGGKISEKNVIV